MARQKDRRYKAKLLVDADVSQAYVWAKAKIRIANNGDAKDYVEEDIFINGNDNIKAAVKGTLYQVVLAYKRNQTKDPYYKVVGIEKAAGETTGTPAQRSNNNSSKGSGGKWIPSFRPATVEELITRAEQIAKAFENSEVLTKAYKGQQAASLSLMEAMFVRSFQPVQAHTEDASCSFKALVTTEEKTSDTSATTEDSEDSGKESPQNPEDNNEDKADTKQTESKSATKKRQTKTTPKKTTAKSSTKRTVKKEPPEAPKEPSEDEDFE
jgi:hypothetical protein